MKTSSLVLAMLCVSVASAQTVHMVPSTAFPTIQSAINGAQSGDTILVAPGLYVENLDFLNKQLDLIGAGIDQSILDGNQSGACISMAGDQSTSRVEGFTIQNGSGHVFMTPGGPIAYGGGLFAGHNSLLFPQPIVRRCRFLNNTAGSGGGIGNIFGALFTIEDCVFEGNTPGAVNFYGGAPHVIRRCVFKNNVNSFGGINSLAVGVWAGPQGTLVEDCVFQNNASILNGISAGGGTSSWGVIGIGAASVTFRRCVFDGNTADRGSVVLKLGSYGGFETDLFEDCLFINNVANEDGVLFNQGGGFEFQNCTFANNTTTSASGAQLLYTTGFYPVPFTNCLVWGNTGGGPLVVNTLNDNSVSFTHCDVEGGWTGAGFGNLNVDPLYEDAMNEDFHIRPDSPCVDAGTATVPFGAVDSDGDARPLFGGVDIGYDECADFVLDPAAAGTAGATALGAPVDVLAVNGSAGGALRRVDLGLGQGFTVTLTPPPGNPSSDFVLYGILGTAKAATVTALPFGLPNMVLPPCDLAPTLQPILFTLATSVSGLSCAPVASTSPAPWNSPAWSLPFPVTFTLQGLIVDTPLGTSLAATNALRVRVQ